MLVQDLAFMWERVIEVVYAFIYLGHPAPKVWVIKASVPCKCEHKHELLVGMHPSKWVVGRFVYHMTAEDNQQWKKSFPKLDIVPYPVYRMLGLYGHDFDLEKATLYTEQMRRDELGKQMDAQENFLADMLANGMTKLLEGLKAAAEHMVDSANSPFKHIIPITNPKGGAPTALYQELQRAGVQLVDFVHGDKSKGGGVRTETAAPVMSPGGDA
jgi:hypothetical protein